MPLRILLADDHHLVRAGIKALLAQFPDYQVVGEAANGKEMLHLIPSVKPDVVLLDISMPELNGLDAMGRMTRQFPQTRFIILSMHATEAFVLRAFRSGASGYLLKGCSVTEFDLALQAAARGEFFVSGGVSHYLVDVIRRDGSEPSDLRAQNELDEELTPREREVLQLIAEGHNTKEIAEKMGISAKTVKSYRVSLMQKLGVHEVANLVRYAIRAGIVNIE